MKTKKIAPPKRAAWRGFAGAHPRAAEALWAAPWTPARRQPAPSPVRIRLERPM
jgi:hypothetical protein